MKSSWINLILDSILSANEPASVGEACSVMETPQWKKILMLSTGLLENFVFSGAILGWSSLNYILKEEGVYKHLCQESNTSAVIFSEFDEFVDAGFDVFQNMSYVEYDLKPNGESWGHENANHVTKQNKSEVCGQQDNILNFVYTIGSFCLGFTAFFWGFLLDKWGLRVTRLIINFMLTTGSLLLSLTTEERSYLLFPAVILLCCGGVPLRIANMQIANLYPKQRSAVITLYSGAFSASAFSFVILKFIYDAGASFFWSCYLLVGLSVLMMPTTIFLLPPFLIDEPSSDKSTNEPSSCPPPPPPLPHQPIFMTKSKKVEIISPIIVGNFKYISDKTLSRVSGRRFSQIAARGHDNPAFDGSLNSLSECHDLHAEDKSSPLSASLLSVAFFLHQAWYAWMVTYMTMYVGSMNLWLDRITHDNKSASDFAKIYGTCQILALVLAPMAGFWMDTRINKADKEEDEMKKRIKRIRSGFWPMLFTTLTLLGIVVCRAFNNHGAIYASIALVTILRSFMVAVGSAYLRARFDGSHFNRLLGIISTVSSIVSLLQFPVFIWEASGPKKFIEVNVFLGVCTGLVMLNPLHLLSTRLQVKLLSIEDRMSRKE